MGHVLVAGVVVGAGVEGVADGALARAAGAAGCMQTAGALRRCVRLGRQHRWQLGAIGFDDDPLHPLGWRGARTLTGGPCGGGRVGWAAARHGAPGWRVLVIGAATHCCKATSMRADRLRKACDNTPG